MTSNNIISNNIIIYNSCFGGEGEGGGIKCWINDKSVIMNNSIVYNSAAHGGGFCFNNNSDPVLINNIIWGNTSPDGSQVNLLDTQSDPDFLYCDIEGRKEAFGGSGSGVNYTGIYENNIDLEPLFRDTASVDYSLSTPSHCIGAGEDTVEVHGITYYAPPFCFMGHPRPDPAGTRPDIGACESPLGTPVVSVKEDQPNSKQFTLEHNYPNPFNPGTKIKFYIPQSSQVQIKVFDVLGTIIETLVNEEKPIGTYELTWKAGNLPSGVYFCQMRAGSFIQTMKMILLR